MALARNIEMKGGSAEASTQTSHLNADARAMCGGNHSAVCI